MYEHLHAYMLIYTTKHLKKCTQFCSCDHEYVSVCFIYLFIVFDFTHYSSLLLIYSHFFHFLYILFLFSL